MKDLPWFALYVKSRHEKNVAHTLRGRGYEAFLPTYRHGVKNYKASELPLFPNYVFCRIELSHRLPVMTTPGVFSIVGRGHEPEPVCEEQVEGIRRMLDSGLMPVPWPHVVPGQEISLESGPLRGVQGVVVDASNGKWLVITVNLLQRSVAVKVERDFADIKVRAPINAKREATPCSRA